MNKILTNVRVGRWYKIFIPSEIEFLEQIASWKIKEYERLGKLFNINYSEADEYRDLRVSIKYDNYITIANARELEACIFNNMFDKDLQEYMTIENFKSTAEKIRQKLYHMYYRDIDYEGIRQKYREKTRECVRRKREREKLNGDYDCKKVNAENAKGKRKQAREDGINNFYKELKNLLGVK